MHSDSNPNLAGLMPTRNYNDICHAFHMLKAMTDWTCVLDDSSNAPFPNDRDFNPDELIRIRRSGLWDDTANRTLLMERACLAGCSWCLSYDDDLLPSKALFHGLREVIRDTDADIILVPLRDLWDDIGRYRTDGLWREKNFPLVALNWMLAGDTQRYSIHARLHEIPRPSNRKLKAVAIPLPYCLYHFGSITAEARRVRVEKYHLEDPRKDFQAIGYDYLADETGLETAPVPAEDVAFMKVWIGQQKILP